MYCVCIDSHYLSRRASTEEFALAEVNLATYTLNTVTSHNCASILLIAYGPYVVERGNLACAVYPRRFLRTATVMTTTTLPLTLALTTPLYRCSKC